jgi:hypothetical protein
MKEIDDCVPWDGRLDRRGYGRVGLKLAHRVAYESANGPIPDGLTVDHLCFTPACVNVSHLRLLTREENTRRQRSALKSHCDSGHPFDEANTYDRSRNNASRQGRRGCRACNAEAVRRYKARKREAA